MGSGRIFFVLGRTCLAATLASSASCAFFYRPPALPQHAAIESHETPAGDEQFAALVQTADIIYFPSELLGSAMQSESGTKLVSALQRSGNAFALAWDIIGGDEQARLDLWARGQISTQELMARLNLSGTARERENCRAVLGKTTPRGVRVLALRCPADLLATARSGSKPDAPARPDAPRGFHPPAGDFEKFAERFSAADGMTESGLRAAYEAALLAEEFAADRIVGQFRAHRDEKLLVFVRRRLLEGPGGVPTLVAQKIKARQLILDSQSHQSRSQLLALR